MSRRKPPVPWYWWPVWMLLLAIGLVVFYGVLTPAWMAFRGVAWLSEARRPAGRSAPAGRQVDGDDADAAAQQAR